MTFTVPYRDTSRTPLAISLSVLLHGLVVAGLVVFLWRHASVPMPQVQSFELFAAPPADTNPDDNPGGSAPAELEVPQLPDITPLPAETPVAVPSLPQPVAPPTPVTPVPPVPVNPSSVKVIKPSPAAPTAKPQPTTRGATAQKPQPSTIDVAAWSRLHPASTVPATGASTGRRGVTPNVGLNPNAYVNALNRAGNGTGRGSSRGTSTLSSAGTDTDYLAYLRKRLQDPFQAPGGVSGQYAVVQLTISPNGDVIVKKIVGSSGNAAFNAAVQAVLDTITNVDPPPGGQEFSRQVRFQPDGA